MNKLAGLSAKVKIVIAVLIVVVVALVAFFVTTGGTNTKNQSVSDAKPTGNQSKQIRLSDALSSKQETIWYQFNLSSDKPATRKTAIYRIIVTKNGYATVYDLSNLKTNDIVTVNSIKDLSDSKIISLAERNDKKSFENQVEHYKYNTTVPDRSNVNSPNAGITDAQMNTAVASLKSLKYVAPKKQKINVNAYNNGQNKTPVKETINLTLYSEVLKAGHYINFDPIGKKVPDKYEDQTADALSSEYKVGTANFEIDLSGQSQWNAEIDGQKFNGFSYDLMTKVKSANINFSLDTSKGSLITSNKMSDSSN